MVSCFNRKRVQLQRVRVLHYSNFHAGFFVKGFISVLAFSDSHRQRRSQGKFFRLLESKEKSCFNFAISLVGFFIGGWIGCFHSAIRV